MFLGFDPVSRTSAAVWFENERKRRRKLYATQGSNAFADPADGSGGGGGGGSAGGAGDSLGGSSGAVLPSQAGHTHGMSSNLLPQFPAAGGMLPGHDSLLPYVHGTAGSGLMHHGLLDPHMLMQSSQMFLMRSAAAAAGNSNSSGSNSNAGGFMSAAAGSGAGFLPNAGLMGLHTSATAGAASGDGGGDSRGGSETPSSSGDCPSPASSSRMAVGNGNITIQLDCESLSREAAAAAAAAQQQQQAMAARVSVRSGFRGQDKNALTFKTKAETARVGLDCQRCLHPSSARRCFCRRRHVDGCAAVCLLPGGEIPSGRWLLRRCCCCRCRRRRSHPHLTCVDHERCRPW